MAEIIYNKKRYKNETQLCKLNGLAYTTYIRRKDRGFPLELCMSKKRVNIGEDESFEDYLVEGEYFPSIKEICLEYGIGKARLKSMRQRFGSFDAAIKRHEEEILKSYKPSRRLKRGTKVEVDGNIYDSLSHACEAYKLPYRRVYVRLYRKWTIDEAFELVDRNTTNEYPLDKEKGKLIRTRRGFSVDKVRYKSLRDAAIAHDIDPRTLAYRVRSGEPVEEALKRPTRKYERAGI